MVTTSTANAKHCGIRVVQPAGAGQQYVQWAYLPLEQLDVHAEIVDGTFLFDLRVVFGQT